MRRSLSGTGSARRVFVTGTDTDVGKTVISAILALAWDAHYWKPVQSGTSEGTDSERIAGWIGPERVHPEQYRLALPVSPHLAARKEGVQIALEAFNLPDWPGPLIVEGAGGVLSPLSERHVMIDLMARLGLPAIVVARDRLGAINQTLLSLQALRARSIEVMGVVLTGGEDDANQQAIEQFGEVEVMGRVPWLDSLDTRTLRAEAEKFKMGGI